MGQYHKVANIDKNEFLHPHDFGDGLKLLEFGCSANGTMSALAAMLAVSNTYEGPWASNRITITGDYGDEGRFVPLELVTMNLYAVLANEPEDRVYLTPEEVAAYKAANPVELAEREGMPTCSLDEWKSVSVKEANTLLSTLGATSISGEYSSRELEAVSGDLVFDQPEDLFDAMQAGVYEDVAMTLAECLRTVRCSKHASKLSFSRVLGVSFVTALHDDKVTHMTVRFDPNNGAKGPFSKTMQFPATSAAVADFFGTMSE